MTPKTAIVLISAALAAGCGGRSQNAKHAANQNYQVVEEGQASGVTSTINGPGETPPPLTDTNLDTTTAFTLPDNPAPLGAAPAGNVAGTFPASPAYPPTYTPAPRPRVVAPPPMASSSAPAPQPPKPQPPPPSDTQVTDEPLPTTTAATTTSTQPPPAQEKPKEQPKPEETKTDTTSTTTTSTAPPPPPPPPV